MNFKKMTFKRIIKGVWYRIENYTFIVLFYSFRVLPLQRKVVATTMSGKKYDDNPKYVFESLLQISPTTKFIWLRNMSYQYDVPLWIKVIPFRSLREIYELSTAKVWISTHRVNTYVRKRKGQLYIETWHGGLGIKKAGQEAAAGSSFRGNANVMKKISSLADVLISGSDHFTGMYKRAYLYDGIVWKSGSPRNDVLINEHQRIHDDVRKQLGVSESCRLFLYAPTFRDQFHSHGEIDLQYYNVDFVRVIAALTKRFGGDWKIMLRWHPVLRLRMENMNVFPNVINVTDYSDLQLLIAASDGMLTDYSSAIMDGALCRIPCFIYATDYEEYKQVRGVQFEIEELPFPYAMNNEELERNILSFDEQLYLNKWDSFSERVGLNETGHASLDIARKISDYLDGKKVDWS